MSIIHRNPQSSHSNTGFHPNLFEQRSHRATNSPVEKKKSKGLHMAVGMGAMTPLGLDLLGPELAVRGDPVDAAASEDEEETAAPMPGAARFAPGFIKVNL